MSSFHSESKMVDTIKSNILNTEINKWTNILSRHSYQLINKNINDFIYVESINHF